MVALLAGLIVGLSVVALSKEVTNTFHEEARVVTAESAIRTALDRLRGDIERASMMSTGNAAVDVLTNRATLGVADPTIYPYAYLRGMAGIRILQGGSVSLSSNLATLEAPLPSSASPAPDAIEITGNLSSNADYYSVQGCTVGAGATGGMRMALSSTDAIYRLGDPDAGGSALASGLVQAFFPDTQPGSTPTNKFYARIIDRNSAAIPPPQQFVVVSGAGVIGGVPYVDLDSTSVLASGGTAIDGGTSTLLNTCDGMIISPVNTVRWRLAITASTAYDANLNSGNDPAKYDLIRTYLDVSGKEVGALGNAQGEIVAEFMIDMAFALSVDQTPAGNLDAGPQILNIPFDGGAGSWAGPITGPETLTVIAPSVPSPQRVRSVTIRLASRAALPDRNTDLTETPPYYYRIAVGDAGKYARVRTMLSEVFLANQGAMTYP
jgi:hypothetical protein